MGPTYKGRGKDEGGEGREGERRKGRRGRGGKMEKRGALPLFSSSLRPCPGYVNLVTLTFNPEIMLLIMLNAAINLCIRYELAVT